MYEDIMEEESAAEETSFYTAQLEKELKKTSTESYVYHTPGCPKLCGAQFSENDWLCGTLWIIPKQISWRNMTVPIVQVGHVHNQRTFIRIDKFYCSGLTPGILCYHLNRFIPYIFYYEYYANACYNQVAKVPHCDA